MYNRLVGFRDRVALLRGLWSEEFAYTGPVSVTVDVTRRCNLGCAGCPAHSPYLGERTFRAAAGDDFDAGMFARLCCELASMGTRNLTFSGEGEPLLHPGMFDLFRLAREAGLRTVLLTNGTLITAENAYRLAATGMGLVRVSLWASSPDRYGANYPGVGSHQFGAAVKGVSLVASASRAVAGVRPRVVLLTVLNRFNWREVDAFVDLALQTKVDAMQFAQMRTLNGRLASLALSKEEEQAVIADLARAARRLEASGVGHNIAETIHRFEIGEAVREKIPCYIAWLHPCIKVDGTVLPCGPCELSMGSLRGRSFREIWNGPEYRSFRRRLSSPSDGAGVGQQCDCGFCCHVPANERVYKYYRWVSPFARARSK